jgi:hypothetical protein
MCTAHARLAAALQAKSGVLALACEVLEASTAESDEEHWRCAEAAARLLGCWERYRWVRPGGQRRSSGLWHAWLRVKVVKCRLQVLLPSMGLCAGMHVRMCLGSVCTVCPG